MLTLLKGLLFKQVRPAPILLDEWQKSEAYNPSLWGVVPTKPWPRD